MPTDPLETLPPEVAEKLGYYVYAYIDPRDERPFYIGKGKGDRVLSHLGAKAENRKIALIQDIRAVGRVPRLDIVQHGIPDEETALRVEAALIDVLGLSQLTNEVRGWRTRLLGREPLSELVTRYAAVPAEINHPAILIRINKLYRAGMSAEEMYEVTRGIWILGDRRTAAKFALAVYRGVVREVYQITKWHPAGTTLYRSRNFSPDQCRRRWEFLGITAPDLVRNRYLYRSVSTYLPANAQAPVIYVNC